MRIQDEKKLLNQAILLVWGGGALDSKEFELGSESKAWKKMKWC
jgi:hypothetical protein